MKTVIWRVYVLHVITVAIRKKEETNGMDMEKRDINRLIKAVESIAREIEKNARIVREIRDERDIKDSDIVYADGEPCMMRYNGKNYIITPEAEEDGEI